MGHILKTKAIVLRTFPFKESSLLCTVFSERFGKLRLMAKGARRPKSKFCGAFEPFSHTELVFYKRETKDVYTISDTSVIDDFEGMRRSPLRFTAAELLCEFVEKTQTMEEPVPELYALLLSYFYQISNAQEKDVRLWTLLMLFSLLKYAGIEPHLKDCVHCHKSIKDSEVYFSIASGGLVCAEHRDSSVIRLKGEYIQYLLKARRRQFLRDFEPQSYHIFEELLKSYISYHLNGMVLNALRFL